MSEYNDFLSQVNNTITIDFCQEILDFLTKEIKNDEYDNVSMHYLEDQLTNKFLLDFSTGKINTDDAKNISDVLVKISQIKYDRWYE